MKARSSRRLLGALTLAGAIGSVSGPAEADDDHAASRTIGDATFMLPAMADSAFVLTEFGFRQGITYQTIPNFPVASFARYDLSWVEFEEQVDVAVRITPWLGLYAQGVASGALGPDTPSLIFEGGGLDFGVKGGAVIRLYRNEHTRSQVAVRAYAGGDAGRTLDLPDFLEAFAIRAGGDVAGIVQNASSLNQLVGALKNEALSLADSNYSNVVFYRSSAMRVGGSLHYAQALVGPLTMQLAANVEQARSQQKPFNPALQDFVTLSTTDTTITFDAVLSASLQRWSVPIGLSAEYASVTTARSLQGANTYGPTTQYGGGGVWFTGRRGVEIGALAFTQRSLRPIEGFDTSDTSGKPTGYVGTLVFRALW
jgi:hypothetical protein